jgi:hypothetical protein
MTADSSAARLNNEPGLPLKIAEYVFNAFIIIVLTGAFLYLVAGCLTQMSRDRAVHVNFNAQDYLKGKFQLDSRKTYHLRLGSAIGGGTVGSFTTRTYFSLFGGSSTTDAEFTPSSTIRMGFTTGEDSYILEIPYSKAKFRQVAGVNPSVKFVTDNVFIDYKSRQNIGHHFFNFERGRLQRVDEAHIWKTKAWNAIGRMGLPTFLNKHLIRVVLTLTPDQYNAYLGTLQTTGKP